MGRQKGNQCSNADPISNDDHSGLSVEHWGSKLPFVSNYNLSISSGTKRIFM
jgi:hypothetical protein